MDGPGEGSGSRESPLDPPATADSSKAAELKPDGRMSVSDMPGSNVQGLGRFKTNAKRIQMTQLRSQSTLGAHIVPDLSCERIL
jgi:hypothetical protein